MFRQLSLERLLSHIHHFWVIYTVLHIQLLSVTSRFLK